MVTTGLHATQAAAYLTNSCRMQQRLRRHWISVVRVVTVFSKGTHRCSEMPASDCCSRQVTNPHLGSGMMLLDLVTMPLTEISLFMSSGFRSLMTLCSAKLKGRTCAISIA